MAVLNERLAGDLFGSAARAVGRTLFLSPPHERTIVGVVENTIYLGLRTRSTPIVYFPRAQRARQLLVHGGQQLGNLRQHHGHQDTHHQPREMPPDVFC